MASFSSFESLNPSPEKAHAESPVPSNRPRLVLCLPSMTPEMLENTLANLATVFAPSEVLIASPDFEQSITPTPLPVTAYEGPHCQPNWVLTAGNYLVAASQAEQHDSASVLMLGSDAATLPPSVVRQMAELLASGIDLTVPSYSLGPHDGLVNAALLYPVTRALFAANIRFPLAVDAGMSRRMASRMTQRHATLSQPEALVWPVSEAAIAAFSVRQVDAGTRARRPPDTTDFNTLFTDVAGSLFVDIEAKASFWQRARSLAPAASSEPPPQTGNTNDMDDELPSMVDAFRLAHNNLHEIWSLILPPQSLLALKKLSLTQPAAFSMATGLWARIVYDFALAFHLRTLNRGHLLGALTPLYMAWAASTLRFFGDPAASATHLEETAVAFEREKSYLVSRWRWPDRFNP
ncbi:MAG TPA: hypothetical protein VIJ65_07685 [Acidobacteriaceae bacterium]